MYIYIYSIYIYSIVKLLKLQFGDYDPGVHQPGFLQDEVLLPQSVVDQFQTVSGQMSEEIIVW